MAINLMMLRSFVAVAQCGNLADAGVQLGRTHSAVSMAVKQLEDHIGARLFEGERKNQLSALGQEVFELAKQQLRGFDDTVGTIETMARSPKGLLRVASVPSVANIILPGAIGKLMSRHPTLQVDLRDADSEIVVDALLHGQADLGVVSGQPTLNGIRQEVLFEDAFGLVCSEEHPLAVRATPPSFEDLLTPDFIANALCGLIRAPQMQSATSQAKLTVHNTLSLISMLRTGRWLTVLPRSVLGILPGTLVFREIVGLTERRAVSLLVRERSLFPDIAQEMADLLRQEVS